MFTALILACSSVITPDLDLCTVDNAVQFAELHRTERSQLKPTAVLRDSSLDR
jgi:hypothetical protein